MAILLIEGNLRLALKNLALAAHPNEAVGLIIPGEVVIPLPNRSSTPRDSFKVGVDDIQLALENAKVDLAPDQWREVVFWHTHPGGGVGPSRLDMRQRVPNLTHLVVTIENDEVVFTWY